MNDMTTPVPPQPDADYTRILEGIQHAGLRLVVSGYLMLWRTIMERATRNRLDHQDALNLVNVTIDLTRLGYVLNSDETDWQPPGEG